MNPKGGAPIYLKLEFFNSSGSIKDRAAYNMIIEAEKKRLLKPNSIIVKPTSGNAGIGIAMNAAARGYKAILVMPETMTNERINLLKAYSPEVVLTPGDEKIQGSIRKVEQLTKQLPNAFIPMQFDNNANPDAHRQTTAKEIIEAMDELGKPLSAFIATSGTGGTITGTGESLKEH